MKSIRLWKVLSILVASLLFIVVLGAAVAQDSSPELRIGVLDDENGPITHGARLAVREINEDGGVQLPDGTRLRLELIVEPTESGNTLAEAIDNLAAAQVIAVLGPATNEDVLSNLPLLQSLGVPVLTPATGDTVIASDATGLIFRSRAAERLLGAALADLLVNDFNIRQFTSVQLDRNSTGGRVGFSIALAQIDPTIQESTILLDTVDDLSGLVAQVVEENAPAVATYGPPELASAFYLQLRAAGYLGVFAYDRAGELAFRDNIPFEERSGILGITTWPFTATDTISDTFVRTFVRAFGLVPGPLDVASYDAIYLLQAAIERQGDLVSNLNAVRDLPGVQGVLNRSGLVNGETSDSVAVIQLSNLGAPVVLARYAAQQRQPLDQPPVEELEPTATPTPEGVIITIESARQNVRTGPGLEYDVLGQLRQGEQARVIGATMDFTWVVIEYRGQNGWLATYLLDVFGDRNTVPIMQPPPTPTPPPATATPTPQPLPDLIITAAAPNNITQGVMTTINVTVRNQGAVNAGPFAIAATFPPDDYFASYNFSGLAAGAEQTVPLQVQLSSQTGNFNVVIVADLNNEVFEGPTGEANNDDFTFNYKVDRQLILINNTNLSPGGMVDLEGNVTPEYDIQYTGAGLNTMGVCDSTANCIGMLSPALYWDTSHYGAITAANGINTTFIPNATLQPGAVLGILTAEGRRGVIRVDNINPGVSITLTYRVYQ